MPPTKTVRSYNLVFDRRWRIHKIQNWRIPLPQGIELRLIAYWLLLLGSVAFLAALPIAGRAVAAFPASIRFGVAPLVGAFALSRYELDGRPAHRALLSTIAFAARSRNLSGLRRCAPACTLCAPNGFTTARDSGSPNPSGRRSSSSAIRRAPSAGSPRDRSAGCPSACTASPTHP